MRELASDAPVHYVLAADARDNDAALASLRPGSLIVNATGLGKDAPGSPLTDAARLSGARNRVGPQLSRRPRVLRSGPGAGRAPRAPGRGRLDLFPAWLAAGDRRGLPHPHSRPRPGIRGFVGDRADRPAGMTRGSRRGRASAGSRLEPFALKFTQGSLRRAPRPARPPPLGSNPNPLDRFRPVAEVPRQRSAAANRRQADIASRPRWTEPPGLDVIARVHRNEAVLRRASAIDRHEDALRVRGRCAPIPPGRGRGAPFSPAGYLSLCIFVRTCSRDRGR